MPYTQDHRSSIEMNSTGAENPPEFPSEEIFLKNFKNISENFAKTAPSIRDRSERGRKPTSRCMRGGERLLELTPSQKKTVRHQFDSFCRKVLREEARDYERHIAWRSDHEVCQYANEHNFELEQVFFHVGQLDYEHPDDVLLRFLRGLQSSRSRIVIAETRDYFPESQMRFIPPTQACFLREHIQQMKVGSRQHPLPAEKRNLSGKPYLYSKEKTR